MPCRGFLVGISPAQQINGQQDVHVLSSWWDSLKYCDHSCHPCPSAGVCTEGFGWQYLSHWTCSLNGNLNQQWLWCCLWTQETGSFSLCVAQKFLNENLLSVASWKSGQRIRMVPSADKISALYLTHGVSIIFSGIWHRKLSKRVSEAEKCSLSWRLGVNQHMEVEGVSAFQWEHWILCYLLQYLYLVVLVVVLMTQNLPRWKLLERKEIIHELVIEILLAFYLLSCKARAYLSCLLSKGHFYTSANKWWSAHEGHSTVAVCERCGERLSLTPLYIANPISSCICQRGKSSSSQSVCYRVIENTAYCRLLFLFQDSFLSISLCAEYNKQNRSWRQFGWGNKIQ